MKLPTTKILPNLQGDLAKGGLESVEYGMPVYNYNSAGNY